MTELKINHHFAEDFLAYGNCHLDIHGNPCVKGGKGYLPRWIREEIARGNVVVVDSILVDENRNNYIIGARGKAYKPFYVIKDKGPYYNADHSKYYDKIKQEFINYPHDNVIWGFGETHLCAVGALEFIGEHKNEDYKPSSLKGSLISYDMTPTMYGGDLE
jgi:hypothetical protein